MPKHQPQSTRRDELEEFKRRINLTEYAASLGYCIDRRASSRNSAVMVHPAGDKIIVAKGEDNHWVYFSVRDDRDHGSIIDFHQRRQGGSIGEIRKVLRPWLNGGASFAGATPPPPATFARDLDPIRRDLISVRVRYEAMKPIDGRHKYLEEVRKIPVHILTDPLFADRIRIDKYGNAIFPHFNRDGLCGWEVKNHGFTGFAKGGVKGLWASRFGPADRRLIIAETAIDALSYDAIKHQPASRYVSTAGELSPAQALLLESAMEKLPAGGQVVLAVDHDEGGDKIGAKIEAIFQSLDRRAGGRAGELEFVRDVPLTAGDDWNDQLRAPAANAGPALAYKPKFASH
jgi:hypothetical protein